MGMGRIHTFVLLQLLMLLLLLMLVVDVVIGLSPFHGLAVDDDDDDDDDWMAMECGWHRQRREHEGRLRTNGTGEDLSPFVCIERVRHTPSIFFKS
jgi:hypothetical protein